MRPNGPELADIEELRKANIQRNKAHLKELGILHKPASRVRIVASRQPSAKKRKIESQLPSRSSARIAAAPAKAVYNEDAIGDEVGPRRSKSTKKTVMKPTVKTALPTSDPPSSADISEVRAGWKSWTQAASLPIQDEDTTFRFADYPLFVPNKSPEDMIREGVFGGSYFRSLYSRHLRATISDDWDDIPKEWYTGLDISLFLTSPDYDPEVNKYKVKCGQSIEEWEAAGWIDHRYDPRGWFQWYCRFFMGRRCEDDERQIGRWARCVGENGRWRRTLLKKYTQLGVREVFDYGEDEDAQDVSPVVHQTCFQWGYE
ncbi:uncharacterized protein KY384_000360 [Bacidia gigantensis]|uniref:uncharacterized protein n=1 Tax=Bacidia gigantensis TaxID=2732470 RepID=UPI001D052975|nr:uncharacterized protein KY384_000360 [Bacidia gigantensis]KAG8526367.1 hypothetical protein KY384_000360 [Bacidia gigantensis]